MMEEQRWFTEICAAGGSAFSMKIREKLHDEQTPHQRIRVYATEWFGNLMVSDGFVMLTARDNFIYHEMLAHPALFSHPSPEHVVIVGGGDCGVLREVLRHARVTQVTLVELDERVTRVAEEFFPELCISNGDPRAHFIFGDTVNWMQAAKPGSVDIIIIDSTDPAGTDMDLYTEAFYRDCHRALGGHGVLVHQSESPLFHMDIINPMRKRMQAAGFMEVQTLFFPAPTYPSGWWTATLAGKLNLSENWRERDAASGHLQTAYYNAAIHRAALTAPEFFHRALV